MVHSLVDLFVYVFNACLGFSDILYVMFACCLVATLVTVFIYLLRGKY